MEKNENIEESSDEEQLSPINHNIINANYENNKLENLIEDISLNDKNKLNKEKKKLNIPRLNFDKLVNNNVKGDDLDNFELNTHDSPTPASSFSLLKTHKKYFDTKNFKH